MTMIPNGARIGSLASGAQSMGAAIIHLPIPDRVLARARAADPRLTWLAVLGITLLGLALRLTAARSIWVDEAISVAQALMPFREMLSQVATGDVHPPLHHVILWATVRTLGDGELAVRLPSIVAGTLIIPVLYAAGREFYGRTVGLVAAVLAAVAPIAVWYSQEARMYALFMLFAAVAVLAQVKAVRTGSLGAWALYTIATALLIWSQYFSVLQVAVQQCAFVVIAWERRRDGTVRRFLACWAASVLALIVLLLPLMPILHGQLIGFLEQNSIPEVPAQAGLGVAKQDSLSIYAAIANGVWAVWGYHSNPTMAEINSLWPLAMLLALALLGRGRSRVSLLLLAIVMGPALLLFGLGVSKRQFFELRYFIGAVPACLLLVARCATCAGNRLLRVGVVGVLLVTLLLGLADQQLNGQNPRLYDFRGGLERVAADSVPEDVLLFEPLFIGPVMDYYAPPMRVEPLEERIDDLPSRAEAPRVYLLGSFLDDPSATGRLGAALHALEGERRLVREIDRPNVHVWVFE
jgi:uncharacterized membrane protein